MPEFFHDCLLVQYADDTQILITGTIGAIENMISRAQTILMIAKTYFNNNGLLLNESKTQCIFFGTRQYISRIPDNISIKIGDTTIMPSQTVKNLGVCMDNYLTFSSHIDAMHKKVTGTLLYLNRVCERFEPNCRVIAVQSLVLSVINYCLVIWGTTNKTQMTRVQRLLNFAAKVAVGGAKRYDHVTPFLNELKWLKMDSKYFYDMCILMFKILNGLLPDWLISLPSIAQVREESICTRQRNNLFIPRTFTETGAKAFNVKGTYSLEYITSNHKKER